MTMNQALWQSISHQIVKKYEYNPENKTGKYDFDINSVSSNHMPQRHCHVRYRDRRVTFFLDEIGNLTKLRE